ncbi:MAG: copy number control protein [Nostoc sp. NMS7]|uniref:plasmid partition protein ParG n=1 Tax=Nostoc sp. NMS7 TaxID=2815391 RepID=UPI0025F09C95|nr:plasmid partition protein ParG [Nostoc sp. NMS7]MBN3949945.1 copy number control protein [Nostoc sp. NMS7]
MPNDEEKIISLRVFMPESLRNNFKAVCAKQGKNMSEVVSDFVRDYVAEQESSSPKKRKGAA